MAVIQKPSVFYVGKKKPDAPAEPVLTKEKMEQCVKNAERVLRPKKK